MSGRPPDRELEAGTAAHYEDPAYYTKTYKTRLDDVRFYVELAERLGGPVLEYGCGNGRITIPTARSGVQVTGVDLSAPMLADLEKRLADEPPEVAERIRLVRGDMREKQLAGTFPLVTCPFNAFLHLYERVDVECFLARVKAHLAPRGRFVVDVSIPEPEELGRDPQRAYHAPRFRYPDAGMVKYTERYDYDKLRQVLFVAMEFHPMEPGVESWMTPLAHRQFFPAELEALFHYNGVEIVEQWGDFDRTKPTRDSRVLILECRAR